MRLSILSAHLPEVEGSAAGRALLALVEGLLHEGHEVDVVSWRPRAPAGDLPTWCEWRPLGGEPRLVTKARALLRPRSDAGRLGWAPAPGARPVADDPLSFPAVGRHAGSVLTLHYLTALDDAALDRRSARSVQDRRAERRAARTAATVLAYSPRVGAGCRAPAVTVPIAYRPPPDPVAPVDEPVAALLADGAWEPNRVAIDRLVRAWPDVRRRVPAARLLLAGRNLGGVGAVAGVEVLGEVARAGDVLGRAGVVAFPCPATSGPKVKVLEALAHGVAVVTTAAGMEGIGPPGAPLQGAVVTGADDLAPTLAGVLLDPGRRAELGAAGRSLVTAVHAPVPAARARVEALV